MAFTEADDDIQNQFDYDQLKRGQTTSMSPNTVGKTKQEYIQLKKNTPGKQYVKAAKQHSIRACEMGDE